jgi:hypothetical protein
MKPYPTYHQREVLQLLMPGDWMPLLKLIPIGDRLLATLLQTDRIERSPDLNAGNFYRVTEAGRSRSSSRQPHSLKVHRPKSAISRWRRSPRFQWLASSLERSKGQSFGSETVLTPLNLEALQLLRNRTAIVTRASAGRNSPRHGTKKVGRRLTGRRVELWTSEDDERLRKLATKAAPFRRWQSA